MKPAKWACCATSILIGLLFGGCARASDQLQHVVQAEIAIESYPSGELPPAPKAVPAGLQWQSQSLPFKKGDLGPGRSRVWVRFTYDQPALDEVTALAYGGYLPSSPIANLYVNGTRAAASDGTLDNGWNAATMITMPVVEPGPTQITLLMHRCSRYLGCGVPTLRIGALSKVSKYFEFERLVRIELPRVNSVSILIVGLFSLIFWIRRRQDVVYGLFTLASVLWVIRTSHFHLSHYPLPYDYFWWLTVSSLSWLAVTVYLFAFRLYGEQRPRTERALYAAAGFATLAGMPFLVKNLWIYEFVAYGAQAFISLLITILLSVMAARTRTREHAVMAAALWVNFACGIYDWLLQNWKVDFEGFFLMPYAAVPLFGAFLYAMACRYRDAIAQVEEMNMSLEARLNERQRELADSYVKLRDYEVQNAQIEERQRLMRDMHDGLGSSLMSSLAIFERGNADPTLMLRTLREAVDDLKLTIDSLEPIEHDLVTLLATLRYRLGPRLERAGLKVDWQVTEVPEIPWLDPAAALQILRIVQESITNVLKHANARCLTVGTELARGVIVSITDDGVGFDVKHAASAQGGRGLRNLRHRASQLGGEVVIASGPRGTTVMLRLPLERHAIAIGN